MTRYPTPNAFALTMSNAISAFSSKFELAFRQDDEWEMDVEDEFEGHPHAQHDPQE